MAIQTKLQSFGDWLKDNPSDKTSNIVSVKRFKQKSLVTPTELAFGSVAVGNQSVQMVATILNTGTEELPINAIEAVGDFFFSTNAPIGGTLRPNESAQIAVSFRPQYAAAVTGGIYVDTGDAAGNRFILLRALGT